MKFELTVTEFKEMFNTLQSPDELLELLRVDFNHQVGVYLSKLMKAELSEHLDGSPMSEAGTWRERELSMEIVAGENSCYRLLAFIRLKMEMYWSQHLPGKYKRIYPSSSKSMANKFTQISLHYPKITIAFHKHVSTSGKIFLACK